MNKIILYIGLLFSFLSAIFFMQRGFSILDVILRSFIIFIIMTIMLSIIALIMIRYIRQEEEKEKEEMHDNLMGNSHE